jgi:hypothetical protein
MKIKILLLFAAALLSSCSGEENENPTANLIPVPEAENKVMLLKVDYTTNAFEGGKELEFESVSETFTVDVDYQTPGDFGGIQLYYDEVNEKLFDGTIHWMGLGSISFPENLLPATAFEHVLTDDFAICVGIENVFNPNNEDFDYIPVWSSVQGLVKVRQYLESNPTATVKLFLYTPSVGIGNPEEWDWIIMLKN